MSIFLADTAWTAIYEIQGSGACVIDMLCYGYVIGMDMVWFIGV